MARKKRKLPDLDYDDDDKKTKFSLVSKLKDASAKHTQSVPITFNVGVAIILFFIYLSIIFVSLPSYPQLLLVILPTLYILVRYIKLERDTHDDRR